MNGEAYTHKKAVSLVGPQDNHVWVLGADVHITSDGHYIDAEEREYIWISDLYTGPGVADEASACKYNYLSTISLLRHC